MTTNESHALEPTTPASRAVAVRPWLYLVDLLTANTLAVLAPFLMFRYVMLKAFQTFHLGVSAGELWANLPALVWRDVLFSLGIGVLLSIVDLGAGARRLWVRLPLQIASYAALPLVVLVIAGSYAVYLELGFFPGLGAITTHLTPGSSLLRTSGAWLTVDNAALVAALIVFPVAIKWLCRRYPAPGRGLALALPILLVVGWVWPLPDTLIEAATHPVGQVYDDLVWVKPDWDLARWSKQPISHTSISGTYSADSLEEASGTLADADVLLVILESTGRQYLHDDATGWLYPNLRRMAASALDFRRYYTAGDSSLPSLFAIFAARGPLPLRCSQWYYPSAGRILWAEELKRRGYRTGFFHSGSFDAFFDRRLFEEMDWDALEGADAIAHRMDTVPGINSRLGERVDERLTIQRLTDWIGQNRLRGRRSLTCYFTAVPHLPYDSANDSPAAVHRGSGRLTHQENYENELAQVDAVLGELYDQLLADGFFENGVLVVTADHGEAFGQHPGVVVHSTHVYQETVHVPLLIVNPLRFNAIVSDNLGSHVDLWPTLADLLGLEVDAAAQGRSLLRPSDRQMVFVASVENGLKLGVIDGRYKYVYNRRQDRAELFDLHHDPAETRNLADEQPDLVRAYHDWAHTFVCRELGGVAGETAVVLETHIRLGYERLASGKLEAARAHFAEALEIEANSAEALTGIAKAQRLLEHRQMGAAPNNMSP